ncbi:hypothetical protein WJX73_010855 [Symbiochloris irregularis]|uniref:Complex III subunit VII n=1 Tax=Symbiochloris irregularis TaxID=706552 RepID=A0AAW1PQC1_9CHLO
MTRDCPSRARLSEGKGCVIASLLNHRLYRQRKGLGIDSRLGEWRLNSDLSSGCHGFQNAQLGTKLLPVQGLMKFMDKPFEWMAVRYQAAVGRELKKYGLRYEDLYDPLLDLDVAEAIRRLPQEEQDLRNQRLKRAHDCSLKKAYLEKDVQAEQTPFRFYLEDKLLEVRAENAERAQLGTGKPYQRTIP